MKKVLLLADADDIFTFDYVKAVILETEISCTILSRENIKNKKWYEDHNIRVVCFGKKYHFWDRKIHFLFLGHFDCFHILEYKYYVFLYYILKMKAKSFIVTFYGSDLFCASKKDILKGELILRDADIITVMSEKMKSSLESKFPKRITDKGICLDFGNSIIDLIDEVSDSLTRNECKSHFGLDETKITIAVGYNGSRRQNHCELIEAISKIETNLLSKIEVLIHLGYGYDQKYFEEIGKLISSKGIKYLILDSFFPPREMAILRRCVDYFVYGNATDAYSSSVIEYLYAGAELIKPIWLDYVLFSESGIRFYEYSIFSEVTEILNHCLKETNELRNVSKDRLILKKLRGWEVLAPEWRLLYKTNGEGY